MEYEILVRKLIELDCLDRTIINQGQVNDEAFNQHLYDMTSLYKLLKCIFNSQHMQSQHLETLKEYIDENDRMRFNYLERVLGEIDIKFDSKIDDMIIFDEFEGSALQEKLFLALIELEEKYINKFLLPKNHYENDVSSTHALSTNQNQEMNASMIKISKYLETATEPNEKEESVSDNFKFNLSVDSEEIKRWVVKNLGESLGISEKDAQVFIINDCEFLAKLLVRGHRGSPDQDKIVKFLGKIKSNFNKLLSISLEWEHEKSFLVYFLPKLAYGFVSKHHNIIEKTVFLYLEFFKRIGFYYNKHMEYDSEDSRENSAKNESGLQKTNNNHHDSTTKTKSNGSENQTNISGNFGKGQSRNIDKKLEEWIFQSNFLELMFHGMEKLGNLDQEFTNIIL